MGQVRHLNFFHLDVQQQVLILIYCTLNRILPRILDRRLYNREIRASSAVRLTFKLPPSLRNTTYSTKSMLFGAAGQSFSMVMLAVMDSIGGKKAGIVGALFLFIFNTFFAIGWLGMTWLYPAEIVPLRIRAPANALSTSANWVWSLPFSFC